MNLNNTNLNLQNIFTNFKDVVKVKDLQKMLGIGRNLLKAPTSTLFELMSFFMEQKKKKKVPTSICILHLVGGYKVLQPSQSLSMIIILIQIIKSIFYNKKILQTKKGRKH